MYCPKCKIEYEEGIHSCADCNVELVPTLENVVWMKPLIKVKEVEVEELIKYLEYSGINNIEVLEEEDKQLIQVGEGEYEKALTYLRVYVQEHMEEAEDEDYYFDEYITDVENPSDKVSEMKTSVTTFGVLGIVLIIGVTLNYFKVYTFGNFNRTMLLFVGLLLGVGCLWIAITTSRSMNKVKDTIGKKESVIEEIIDWYKKEKGIDTFFERHKVEKGKLDEGALYFYISDKVKLELKEKYEKIEEKYINEAIEVIHEKIVEKVL